MELSEEQEKAAEAIRQWYDSDQQCFFLAGYAGTGKSTIVSVLLPYFRSYIMVAPTGKAAAVLSEKTGDVVTTIHSLLYLPNEKIDFAYLALQEEAAKNPDDKQLQMRLENYQGDDNGVEFSSKKVIIDPRTVVVIDEASMVGERIFEDLKDTGAKLLFIGDQGQLPPVKAKAVFHNAKKGATLTKVFRQALDSPILRLATDIRNQQSIRIQDYLEGDCQIRFIDEIDAISFLCQDQIITDTNASRHKINRFFRKQYGYGEELVHKGEKLICVKNDWNRDPPFINGIQCEAISDIKIMDDLCGVLSLKYCMQDISTIASINHFQKNYGNNRYIPWTELDGMCQLDYGYALTVHKSQGSEWGSVMFADSGNIFNRYQNDLPARQMIYTAITRASKQFTWVMK